MKANDVTGRRGFLSSVVAVLASWGIPEPVSAASAVVSPPVPPPLAPLAPVPLRTEAELGYFASLSMCCRKLVSMHAPAEHKKRLWDDYPWIVLPQHAQGCHALCKHTPDDDHRRYVPFNMKTRLAGPTFRDSNEAKRWWRAWKARNETGVRT